MQTPRTLRRETISEAGGRFWMGETSPRRPLNLLARGFKVLVAHLAAKNPGYDVTSKKFSLRGEALKLTAQLDALAIERDEFLFARLCLMEAIFASKCVTRCGSRTGSQIFTESGRERNIGQPYHRIVDFDDWLPDPAARSREEMYIEGERYRLPREHALALVRRGVFGRTEADYGEGEQMLPMQADPEQAAAIIENLPSLRDGRARGGEDRAEDLTRDTLGDHRRFGLIDLVELIDVAVYDEEMTYIVTLPAEDLGEDVFLKAEAWGGPERGPFEWLELQPMPQNLNGVAPAGEMREQSELANTIVEKMASQIERTKKVLVYQRQREQDALSIAKSGDGTSVGIDGDPAEMANVDLGGISADLAPFLSALVGWWNAQNNNVDLMGGTGVQTDKATGQAILAQNSNVMLDDLGSIVENFHARLGRQDCWQLMHNPAHTWTGMIRLPSGALMEVQYDAMAREGDELDFVFRVKRKSTRSADGLKVEKVSRLLEVIMGAAEVEASTGIVDTAAIVRLVGRESELDELDEIVRDPLLRLEQEELYASVAPRLVGQLQPMGEPGVTPGRAGGGGRAVTDSRGFYRARPGGGQGGAGMGARPRGGASSNGTVNGSMQGSYS